MNTRLLICVSADIIKLPSLVNTRLLIYVSTDIIKLPSLVNTRLLICVSADIIKLPSLVNTRTIILRIRGQNINLVDITNCAECFIFSSFDRLISALTLTALINFLFQSTLPIWNARIRPSLNNDVLRLL